MYGDRVSKAEITDRILNAIQIKHNFAINKVIDIGETPDVIRHSCIETGISILERQTIIIPMEHRGIEIPYYICPVCCSLYICKEYI